MQRSTNEILTNDLIAELERDTRTAIDDGEKETLIAYANVADDLINKILDALEAERWDGEKERRDLLDRLERERSAHTETARFFKATIGNMNDLVNQYRERLKYYVKNGGPNEIN